MERAVYFDAWFPRQHRYHVACTTQGMVAAGLALTFSAPPWLEGVEGITWRPIADVRIEIRTAAAWRTANRSPLLRSLLQLLPAEQTGADTDRDGAATSATARLS